MARFDDQYFEALEADLAKREASDQRDRADEVLAARECEAVAPSATSRVSRERHSTAVAQTWQSYIAREIRAAERRTAEACMAAAGEVLSKERAERTRLEAEVSSLKLEVAELRGRIIERGDCVRRSAAETEASASRLKVVPPSASGMIA
jgi:hypothetical protein